MRLKLSALTTGSHWERDVWWEDLSINENDETRQREEEWTGLYWQPGALVWGQPCRASIALFGTWVDPGTQNEARPLTWFSCRPEPPHREDRYRTWRVTGQIQCDFSPLSFVLVVQGKRSHWPVFYVCVHRMQLNKSVIGLLEASDRRRKRSIKSSQKISGNWGSDTSADGNLQLQISVPISCLKLLFMSKTQRYSAYCVKRSQD